MVFPQLLTHPTSKLGVQTTFWPSTTSVILSKQATTFFSTSSCVGWPIDAMIGDSKIQC